MKPWRCQPYSHGRIVESVGLSDGIEDATTGDYRDRWSAKEIYSLLSSLTH
jgi:hypothetical protein